jgi:multicomponent Na+:H+ antiporter subunit E
VPLFALNLVLALGWCALTGGFTASGYVAGFAVGFLVLAACAPLFGPTRYFVRLVRALDLALFFLVELVLSTIRVSWDVLTPTHRSRPGVVAVPLEPASDLEIALLATLVTLTPGTLALELADDRRTLYVHVMFLDEPEALRAEIKGKLERRVLEVTR